MRPLVIASLVGLFAWQQAAPAQDQRALTTADHQDMMRQLGITALRPGPSGDENAPNHANYDEAAANPFPTLPDPLTTNAGRKVTTAAMWNTVRRPEIIELFERDVIGRVPKNVPKVTWTVTETNTITVGSRQATSRTLVGHVDNSGDPAITVDMQATLVTPADVQTPVPVMIMFRLAFPPGRGGAPGGRGGPPTPPPPPPGSDPPSTDQLIADGWGYVSFSPTTVQADNGAGLTSGIIGLTNKGQRRKPDDWGALRAWAWGASRILDYLQTDRTVDAKHVGIEGVSRYGKAALITMAFDQRFAVVLVGSSGEGGAKLHRRNWGEAVENLTGSGEYHWMAGNFLKYGASESTFGSKTAGDIPVDAHELIALCAPRPTFISYGVPEKGDAKWLDHQGSYMATVAAQPVFRLLGAKDLGVSDDYKTEKMPAVNVGLLAGQLAWRQHDGGHTDAPNWRHFIPWADRMLGRPPRSAPAGSASDATPRTDENSKIAHEQLLEKKHGGRIDVYFEGDSITRRWGATDYPELLANWRANFFGWNAADFGWGADKVQNILWRLENGELDGIHPKVIVLLAGTNNIGGVPGDAHKVADITRALQAVVDLMRKKAPSATIVLTAIFPRNDNLGVMPEIDRVNADLAKMADGRTIRYLSINDKLADRRGWLFDGMMNPDHLHPTVRGYQIWADALKPLFTEILGPPAATDQAPPPTSDPSAAKKASSSVGQSVSADRSSPDAKAAYRDPTRSVDERVADLLGRMALEEKVAQLEGIWQKKPQIQDADGRFDPTKAKALLEHGIGEISRPSETNLPVGQKADRSAREHAEYVNAIQHWLIDNTRLGIPAMFHDEALHGFVAPGATNFPVPIALGSSWDPSLVERVMSVAAREARARGSQHVLSPVVDLGRDPRWGRIEETYGEDPYLVSRMGVAAVVGYQGRTLPLAGDKVYATLKHFAGHGSHEGGINTAPALVPERLLRSELLVPFEAGVRAGAYTVMPSYNDVDGIPSHVNAWLLEDVLRREWGFQGLVASDYFAVDQLVGRHHVARDKADAAEQALTAGVDIELPDPAGYPELVGMVRSGHLAESVVDRAAARVLRAKFLAGLFEHPFVDADLAERLSNTPESQALALDAARRSIVLLKNANHVLPFDRTKLKTVAVIGPDAKGVHLGGYSKDPGRGVDALTGITAAAGPGAKVLYSEGVRITEHDANWGQDKVVMGDPALNRARIQDAVKIAKQADAIVLVIGTNESVSREAYADNHLGDAASLSLMSQQQDLADALIQLGKPLVVVLMNGRPLAIPELAQRAPAILETWYTGQAGGTAIGETLYGMSNPGGKLPVTIPRSVGQLPVYYNRNSTSFRDYVDLTREPLWPFGFGLSYTTFTVTNVSVSPATIGPAGHATVTADVTNTGGVKGDEIVQLYVHDVVSSVARPTKELRGFDRVTLNPGEKRTVTFVLGPDELSLINRDMKRVVEPGKFEIMVGTSSTQLTTVNLEVAAR
jgi:beta-glucosidase